MFRVILKGPYLLTVASLQRRRFPDKEPGKLYGNFRALVKVNVPCEKHFRVLSRNWAVTGASHVTLNHYLSLQCSVLGD